VSEPVAPILEQVLTAIADEIAQAAAVANGRFYPAWGKGSGHMSTHTCYHDDEYPAYMSGSAYYIKPTLEECCETHFRWAKSQCMADGGADISSFATEKWYISWEDEMCVQDCFDSDKTATKNCGGLANAWKTLHADAETCCNAHMFWAVEGCVTKSNNIVVNPADLGTGKYYIKYPSQTGADNDRCVKDCDASIAGCGGLKENWNPLYETADDCCARIDYVQRNQCLL